MRKSSQLWLAAAAALWASFVLAAVLLPRSFTLTLCSDLIQCALLVSGAASFVPLALRSRGRMRLFWSLITLGIFFWLTYQVLWTYFEVVLGKDVPDLFAGDMILFLHIVPLMAALALRPHSPADEHGARVGRLDFALLLMWWLYLYVLIVTPWQYVVADVAAYNRHLNAVYVTEEIAYLVGLAVCWSTSKGDWRNLYANLFGMSLCYAGSSTVMNWAIGRDVYYSGSLYDIPYVTSIVWVTWIGLRIKAEKPTSDAREASTSYGVWVARCSMISVFSLPLFAAWAMSDNTVPYRVGFFRLMLTLVAAFFMGMMVLFRQHLLDRELTQLLRTSRESCESLNHLQAQILQSEKLASIGALAGGAAHELNNPITAMLGYSDMLLSTALTAEQRPLAGKIGQHVRRTKSLVASLISFARQSPAPKSPLDLNTLARTAVKLTQPQWEACAVEVRMDFDSGLPKVLGDSNQLLQVCLQLVTNCVHVLNERGGRVLTVSTAQREGKALLVIAAEGGPGKPTPMADGLLFSDSEEALGLSACQGILQEHRGGISREVSKDGTLLLRVEIPVTQSAPSRAKEATVPVMWQSRPYA